MYHNTNNKSNKNGIEHGARNRVGNDNDSFVYGQSITNQTGQIAMAIQSASPSATPIGSRSYAKSLPTTIAVTTAQSTTDFDDLAQTPTLKYTKNIKHVE